MANAFLLALGVVLLVAQSVLGTILPVEWLAPSLLLPLVLYMAVGEYSLARGVSLAFVLGYLTDAFSGGSMGLWTFSMVSVFLLARVAGLKLFLHGVVFQVILTFMACFVVGLLMMGLSLVFDRRPLAVLAALAVVLGQSLATAACAPGVFALVRRIPGAAPPKPEEAS